MEAFDEVPQELLSALWQDLAPPMDERVFNLAGHFLYTVPAYHHPECVCGRCYPQGTGLIFSKRVALRQLGTWLMNLLGGP
jgi:hypothetical protein